jgi:hypothetical protein
MKERKFHSRYERNKLIKMKVHLFDQLLPTFFLITHPLEGKIKIAYKLVSCQKARYNSLNENHSVNLKLKKIWRTP